MTRTEVSRNFCVSESLLSSYEASGLILCSQDTAGEPIYQAQEIQLVGLISSLLDSGMEQEALRRYISLRTEAKDTRPEQVRILRRHRAKLLDDQQISVVRLRWITLITLFMKRKKGGKTHEQELQSHRGTDSSAGGR